LINRTFNSTFHFLKDVNNFSFKFTYYALNFISNPNETIMDVRLNLSYSFRYTSFHLNEAIYNSFFKSRNYTTNFYLDVVSNSNYKEFNPVCNISNTLP